MDAEQGARGSQTQIRDGRAWRIGGALDVAWIAEATAPGPEITSAVPPNFAAYCAVALPEPEEGAQRRHDHAVIATLTSCTDAQPWWLGYLETSIGAEEVVFYDAPRVTLYENWNYVLVEAGPDQALSWRQSEGPRAPWKGAVPDIMFPADRSWLLSTLWDDHWSGIGGSEALIAAFAHDRLLGGQTRVVGPCEDAAPPRRA